MLGRIRYLVPLCFLSSMSPYSVQGMEEELPPSISSLLIGDAYTTKSENTTRRAYYPGSSETEWTKKRRAEIRRYDKLFNDYEEAKKAQGSEPEILEKVSTAYYAMREQIIRKHGFRHPRASNIETMASVIFNNIEIDHRNEKFNGVEILQIPEMKEFFSIRALQYLQEEREKLRQQPNTKQQIQDLEKLYWDTFDQELRDIIGQFFVKKNVTEKKSNEKKKIKREKAIFRDNAIQDILLSPIEYVCCVYPGTRFLADIEIETQGMQDMHTTYDKTFRNRVKRWNLSSCIEWLYIGSEEGIDKTAKQEILETRNKNYSTFTYTLKLFKKSPKIGEIQPQGIALYLKETQGKVALWCKVKGKDEQEIYPADITSPSGLSKNVINRFIAVLKGQDPQSQYVKDQWRMINYLAISEYLPKDFSSFKTSQLKRKPIAEHTQHILAILKPKKTTALKPRKTNDRGLSPAEHKLLSLYQKVIDPTTQQETGQHVILSNNLFKTVKELTLKLQLNGEKCEFMEDVKLEHLDDYIARFMPCRQDPHHTIILKLPELENHVKDMGEVLKSIIPTAQEFEKRYQQNFEKLKANYSDNLQGYKKLCHVLEESLKKNTNIYKEFETRRNRSILSCSELLGDEAGVSPSSPLSIKDMLNLSRAELSNDDFFDENGQEKERRIPGSNEWKPILFGYTSIDLSHNNLQDRPAYTTLKPLDSSAQELLSASRLPSTSSIDISSQSVCGKPVMTSTLVDLHPTRNPTFSTNLRELNLAHNQLSSLKMLYDTTTRHALYSKLEILDVSHNPIKIFSFFHTLPSLTSLQVSHVTLYTTANRFTNLTDLSFLDLSDTHIADVDGLSSCTSLTSLNIASNLGLKNIDALSGLTRLTNLDLSQIPQPFKNYRVHPFYILTKLTDLHTLRLQNNSLKTIGIVQLSQIQTLDICGNPKLKSGHANKTFFPNLETLIIDEGQEDARPLSYTPGEGYAGL